MPISHCMHISTHTRTPTQTHIIKDNEARPACGPSLHTMHSYGARAVHDTLGLLRPTEAEGKKEKHKQKHEAE